jgi:hypothetical protein
VDARDGSALVPPRKVFAFEIFFCFDYLPFDAGEFLCEADRDAVEAKVFARGVTALPCNEDEEGRGVSAGLIERKPGSHHDRRDHSVEGNRGLQVRSVDLPALAGWEDGDGS